jgi:hypothetical protein
MSGPLAAPAREESPRREVPWTDRLLARATPKVRTWVLFAWEALPRRSDLGDLPGYVRSLRILWTLFGEYTMLFPLRARALHRLARRADRDGVPGALVDCGTWNGGSTALLSAASPQRPIWAFDSFEGTSAATEQDGLTPDERAFSAGQCRGEEANLRQAVALFGAPDNLAVRAGWFEDTLEPAVSEVGAIAVLHVDADWYEPVRLALEAFYPLVSPGGWIVIDDYGALPGAARATEEFRAAAGDDAPLVRVDQTGRYWRKPRAA